jgi:tetratricopeptide (TPR) repeat protein
VLARCLRAIKPYVDHWTIMDTGSTDHTKEIVREVLGDVPGKLYEREWVNWHTNMTETFELAKTATDYVWVIDADEEVKGHGNKLVLTADAYLVSQQYRGGGADNFERMRILATRLPWKQKGMGRLQIHEYPDPDCPYTRESLPGIVVLNHNDGQQGASDAATRRERYRREAESLEELLAEQPNHHRAAYYLGQSYRDSGQIDKAIRAYEQRGAMKDGWDEEAFMAVLEAARLRDTHGYPEEETIDAYRRASSLRPWRAEPLCYLATFHRNRKNWQFALAYARLACSLPRPGKTDIGFLDASVYAWRARDELSIALFWTGDYAGCRSHCLELLGIVPENERERVRGNMEHAERALAKGSG